MAEIIALGQQKGLHHAQAWITLVTRDALGHFLFQIRQFVGRGSGQLLQQIPGRAVVTGGFFLVRLRLAQAVEPVPRHIAQLARPVDIQHGLHQYGRFVLALQQFSVTVRPLLLQHGFNAAEGVVDLLQVQARHIVPDFRSAGGMGARGAFRRRMAGNAAVEATARPGTVRRKTPGHKQGNGAGADAVFGQQHIAPAVHADLVAGKSQVPHGKTIAQQIGVAVTYVGEIRHQIVPLQADFLGQIRIEIEIVAVGHHADAGPAGTRLIILFVETVQIVAQKGAQHQQIVHGHHDKGFVHDGLDLVLLQQRLNALEHGAPAALKGLVQRAAQRMQNGEPGLGGGIRHAHVHHRRGPVHGGHALTGRTAFKGNAGQREAPFPALGMHPDFQAVPNQHLLGLQGAVQGKTGRALAAQLQASRKKLNTDGQLIEIAPDHKPGQGQKDIIGKKEPEGLFTYLAHQHAAVVEQGLAYRRGKGVVPADPEHMPHGAHVHILALGQAGQKLR